MMLARYRLMKLLYIALQFYSLCEVYCYNIKVGVNVRKTLYCMTYFFRYPAIDYHRLQALARATASYTVYTGSNNGSPL